MICLPDPVVEEIAGFRVVRDDYLPGGTKMRAMLPVLRDVPAEEFIYASPAYGYAQVALPHIARALGRRATIFTAKRKAPHKRTLEAKGAGAKVVMVPHGYLSNVQSKARQYAERVGGFLVPFGVEDPRAMKAIARAAHTIHPAPDEVWTVSGSGVLTRSLQLAWPGARFCTVQVGKPPAAGRARVFVAPESFEQDAKVPPPFPSCSNYDAKAWRFMLKHASKGALFWNVAR